MIRQFVIEWEACKPIGERAVVVNTFSTTKANRYGNLLGHVWPKRRGWCASDASGCFMGHFRTQDQARRRVVQGQVLNGEPVLVRSKG